MREPIAEMTVDEFLVWSETRPGRYELVGATVHEMASERIRHTLIKGAAYRALGDAVRRAGLP